MKLIKNDVEIIIDNDNVISAFKDQGWSEAPEAVEKPKTKKATKSNK